MEERLLFLKGTAISQTIFDARFRTCANAGGVVQSILISKTHRPGAKGQDYPSCPA